MIIFFGGAICGLFKPFYPFLATFDLLLVSKKPGGADLPPPPEVVCKGWSLGVTVGDMKQVTDDR